MIPLFGPEHDELRATIRRFVARERRPTDRNESVLIYRRTATSTR